MISFSSDSHIPVNGHSPMHLWVTLTGLSEFYIKRDVEMGGVQWWNIGGNRGGEAGADMMIFH